MIATAFQKFMFVLRLTLMVTLVGYMMPSVSYAMKCVGQAPVVSDSAAAHGHADKHHHHSANHTSISQGSHSLGHEGSDAVEDCCSDFCLSLALAGTAMHLSVAAAGLPGRTGNDAAVIAEPLDFHRPPALRA